MLLLLLLAMPLVRQPLLLLCIVSHFNSATDQRLFQILGTSECTEIDPLEADVIEAEERPDGSGGVIFYSRPSADESSPQQPLLTNTNYAVTNVADVCLACRAVRNVLAFRLAARGQDPELGGGGGGQQAV